MSLEYCDAWDEIVPLFPPDNCFEENVTHADMVFDEIRVSAYKSALEQTVKEGDVVVDIGAGVGVLSFLALKSGAKLVHAIERFSIIEAVREIAQSNNLDQQIIFHNSSSTKTELGERVDLIVSETIGHMAFEEGIAESLFDAKKRFLKPGGRVIPESLALYWAPFENTDLYKKYFVLPFQSYPQENGLDHLFREICLNNIYITDIEPEDLLSEPKLATSVDFAKDIYPDTSITDSFTILRDGELCGMAFWFGATLSSVVHLTNKPGVKTHWRQCFLPALNPVRLNKGDEINFSFQLFS